MLVLDLIELFSCAQPNSMLLIILPLWQRAQDPDAGHTIVKNMIFLFVIAYIYR